MSKILDQDFFKNYDEIIEELNNNHNGVLGYTFTENSVLDRLSDFGFVYEEGIKDWPNSQDELEKFQRDFEEVFRLGDEELEDAVEKIINYWGTAFQGYGGFSIIYFFSERDDSYRKFKNRIFLENIYFDLFKDSLDFYNPNIIKYFFKAKEKMENQTVKLSDFDFVDESQSGSGHNFNKFPWLWVKSKEKITNYTNEIRYKLNNDEKYKYIIYAEDRIKEKKLVDGSYTKSIFLQQVLALTHGGEIEVIKDFTKENSMEIEMIEKI